MVLAARLSTALGLADAGDGERLRALLARYGLPTAVPPGRTCALMSSTSDWIDEPGSSTGGTTAGR